MKNIDDLINDDELKYRILSIANKKCLNYVDRKDLLQAGYIGAIKAAQGYNESFNTSFYTYAYPWILGEMCECINKSRGIKLNKKYLKIYRDIESARQILTQKLNRIPTNKELSTYLETPEEVIEEICLTCSCSLQTISLDSENEVLNDNNIYSLVGKEYDYDTSIMIQDSLENLDELERKVIDYRYFKDYTQQEVADILGIKQVKVSRLETKSKRKIKEYLCA